MPSCQSEPRGADCASNTIRGTKNRPMPGTQKMGDGLLRGAPHDFISKWMARSFALDEVSDVVADMVGKAFWL